MFFCCRTLSSVAAVCFGGCCVVSLSCIIGRLPAVSVFVRFGIVYLICGIVVFVGPPQNEWAQIQTGSLRTETEYSKNFAREDNLLCTETSYSPKTWGALKGGPYKCLRSADAWLSHRECTSVVLSLELMFSAIVMYVLLLVLLNVVLMVPLRIQTSVTIWSVILWVSLIEQKRFKWVKIQSPKRWNTVSNNSPRGIKESQMSDKNMSNSAKAQEKSRQQRGEKEVI